MMDTLLFTFLDFLPNTLISYIIKMLRPPPEPAVELLPPPADATPAELAMRDAMYKCFMIGAISNICDFVNPSR